MKARANVFDYETFALAQVITAHLSGARNVAVTCSWDRVELHERVPSSYPAFVMMSDTIARAAKVQS